MYKILFIYRDKVEEFNYPHIIAVMDKLKDVLLYETSLNLISALISFKDRELFNITMLGGSHV